jgi:hypothetical protein
VGSNPTHSAKKGRSCKIELRSLPLLKLYLAHFLGDCLMQLQVQEQNGVRVAVVKSEEKLIIDVPSVLDLMIASQYETNCNRIAINKEVICEEFFVLSTHLAGEILQKFTNYQMKLAIYGDFSRYTSKPLRDFIYESNQGSSIFFLANADDAVAKLCGA